MKKIEVLVVLLLLMLSLGTKVLAQEDSLSINDLKESPTIYKRNNIYGTISYGLAMGTMSLNYEQGKSKGLPCHFN